MLSGPERRSLDAIAKHLLADDPQLCRALQMGQSPALRRWKLGACGAGAALGMTTMAAGVLLLSFGLVVFGGLFAAMSALAFVRVRNDRVVDRPRPTGRRDPGGDVTPTWWSAA